jgi:glutaredoxin
LRYDHLPSEDWREQLLRTDWCFHCNFDERVATRLEAYWEEHEMEQQRRADRLRRFRQVVSELTDFGLGH